MRKFEQYTDMISRLYPEKHHLPEGMLKEGERVLSQCVTFQVTDDCNLACFIAGTKILMSDFSCKNIEDIKVGDKVLAFDEHTEKGKQLKLIPTTVTHTFLRHDYVRKINANAEFAILNGRMPKLGSIEYLLRASNFLKSGIFGLTINNVIELLTPYKHGDFNRIKGDLKVSDAKIQDLKIYSQGDNLSTYTFGTYDILGGVGDIEILGKLSKKISNILGPIGNTSVVSILNMVTRNKMDELVKTEMLKNVNKIPLMDLNNDDYRLFNVKIEGPATADNIVKSFTWLN